jgi:hypothetical protein
MKSNKPQVDALANLFMNVDVQDEEHDVSNDMVSYSVRSTKAYFSQLNVLAKRIGVSRNEMTNQLLQRGINSLLAAFPDDLRIEILTEAGESLSDL